ncbi:MAG: hypothetical protein KGD63_13720 [Candidatus Lokiarchaeota archaeon]|nr:hypothetical protein [Candidatus Lokiarchaeota archaeon]
MVLLTDFRLLNNIERKIIKKTFLKISKELISFLDINLDYLYILIDKNNKLKPFPEIYYYHNLSKYIIEQFKSNIYYAGIYFGFIKRGDFYLSLECIEFIDNKKLVPKKIKIKVNEKAEKSILYGNNIKKKMISSLSDHIEKDNYIIIYNKFNELIALGYLIINTNEIKDLQDNRDIALNLIDKGYFLRNQ